jgi:plastocyanin
MLTRLACLGALVVAASLTLVPPAVGATRTYTLRYGPMRVGGFETVLPKVGVRTPRVNGHIVRMHARLVNARGIPVTVRDVMLHHVFFQRRWRPTVKHLCQGGALEAFYGTGEEDQTLRLPHGYGYRIRANDRWRMNAMVMSHRAQGMNVYMQYRVTVDTSSRLRPVRAFWLRANGCPFPWYFLSGDGPPGSTNVTSYDWKVPYDLKIVAAGGHLHGGARDMWLSQPRCGNRRLLDNRPAFGMPDHVYYTARPILHEPGPVDTRYFMSRTGLGATKGEVIRISAAYAADHPRTVMAVMHVYVVRERHRSAGCAPLPPDRVELTKPGPTRPEAPPVTVPLTGLDARGHTYTITDTLGPSTALADGATIKVADDGFYPRHIALPGPATLKWTSVGSVFHNVRLADGPRTIATPTLAPGRKWPTSFSTPGRYKLFCTWHPMTMHAIVDVG